ncbi:MAG: hypothetical protein LBJ12_09775 [Oscillospiraceae bacterium]|nr:hypothetical protein [Oscillospiraceae bacterium]
MKKYKIILPSNSKDLPEEHEITAAKLLANHFQTDVEFISRSSNKTPDLKIGSLRVEIKSPTGKGKRNIQHTLQNAQKQSSAIVFDARRSKIHIEKIRRELDRQFKMAKSIKKLLLIKKDGAIVDFEK